MLENIAFDDEDLSKVMVSALKRRINSDNMPFEKMIRDKTARNLENYELIALVLGSGSAKKGVIELSKEIASMLERLKSPPKMEQLLEISGLGPVKSAKILACVELSGRFLFRYQQNRIESPSDLLPRLSFLKNLDHEEFVCVTLDSDNYPVEVHRLTKGLVNQTPIHPREAFRQAVNDNATAVIFAHNHPSGRLEASTADLNITSRLARAGNLMGIQVLDHLIVCRTGWISLKKEHPHSFS